MRKHGIATAAIALSATLLLSAAAAAQDVPFRGEVTTVADDASTPLLDLMRSRASEFLLRSGEDCVWIGYHVTARERLRDSRFHGGCDSHGNEVTVTDGVTVRRGADEGIEPEGSERKAVLYLYRSDASLRRVRLLELDERYRFTIQLLWLQDVPPERSLDALEELLNGAGVSDDLRESALTAIAVHQGSRPGRILEGIVRSGRDVDLREQALFWFGFTIDPEDIGPLRRLEGDLRPSGLREHLTFVYYLQKSDAATERLIDMARGDADREVREQAIFWLGQLASARAAEELGRLVEDDPDAEIRAQAVFALSQLESPRGLELLMRVAGTSPNPDVRRAAIFWIGQSGDPRAVDFLEQLLRD